MSLNDTQPPTNLSPSPEIRPITAITTIEADPPPPYPSHSRRIRHSRRSTAHHPHHLQTSSTDSHSDLDTHPSPQVSTRQDLIPDHDHDHGEGEEGENETETTPFLSTLSHNRYRQRRPQSISHASTMSAVPSLVQTCLSLFSTDDDGDDYHSEQHRRVDGTSSFLLMYEDDQPGIHDEFTLVDGLQRLRRSGGGGGGGGSGCSGGAFFSKERWKRYFRPVMHKVYYRSLFHLFVINFPYALAAWVYLFVFTVTGTTLIVALPLGVILCFFDLLGARTFARGELALQTRFHSPLSYPAPYPPRPIFYRLREVTSAEVEPGFAAAGDLVEGRSFYQNAYALFTDPTSYQALFYFLVVKPSITIVLSLGLIVLVLPALVLVVPAPAALRAVRRLGVWQANIAVEGLYWAVG